MCQNLKKFKNIYSFSGCKLFILFCFLSLTAFSQENRVSGSITDSNGDLLLGVSVIEIGTTNGVVSDFDGNYSIQLKRDTAVLEFSYTGFKTVEISITDKKQVDVILKPSTEELEEVVVIGYGTVKKKDVLGAIGSVKAKELSESIPIDAIAAMQGRVAGVQIFTNSGAPGETSDVVIRGLSTLSGGVSPLYVVDGQQLEDIDFLNPEDIESIDVLKDGASAAIYGSRSVNGVIMITTKKGKAGFVKVKTSINSGISFLNRKIPVSNSFQRIQFELQRTKNKTSGSIIKFVNDTLGVQTQISNDLQEIISKIGLKTQVNASFSGGSETAKFYFSTGILKQEGIVLGSGYDKFTTSLKADFDIGRRVSVGSRINSTYQNTEGINEGAIFKEVSYRQPNVLIYDYDGSYFPVTNGRKNPVSNAALSVKKTRVFKVANFSYIDFKITPGLSFKTNLGVNFNYQKRNNFSPSETIEVTSEITGKEENILLYDFQNENFFNYNKKLKGGHLVSGLLGMSIQKWNNETAVHDALEFNNDAIQTFNNVVRYNTTATQTTQSENSLSSVYARVSYDYKKKYFVAGSFRRDGSSRFGDDKLWGNFPSVSAGWNLHKEKFMNTLDFISLLKLRASYAITGNERIPNDRDRALYDPGYTYEGVNGFAPAQLGNADLKWEETAQQNYGLDLNLFNNRIQLNIDGYIKTTTDLLYDVRIPEETGFSNFLSNVGSIENKGIEIQLSGTVFQVRDFKWFSSFNIAFNKNKVLDLSDEDGFETASGAYFIEEGKPIGNMYGYRNLGVFQYDESNAFTDVGVQLTPNFDDNNNFVNYSLNGETYTGTVNQLKWANNVLKGGDIIWEDQNGDFNIQATNDRVTIGNGLVDFNGGFRNVFEYKDISLSFLFDFSFGNDIYRKYDDERDKSQSGSKTPGPARIDNAWQEQGDLTNFPILLSNRPQNRTGFDSNYVSQADYIRLQNINISYRFPKKVLNKIGFLENLSLNTVVNNVMTFTNYEGYNPSLGFRGSPLEPGFDTLRYPNKIEFIFGLVAQF